MVQWTSEQTKVIETRGDNILVAASAGSGKTAVLVARILSLITDEKDPADIDELLIVTFTKAAAGEMRERIGAAIAGALADDPDNERLLQQSQLLHNAKITTIDGFCSFLVRSYCHLTELEPGFRVADEGESQLLKADVMAEILEECFSAEDEREREDFYDLVETFATGKSEKALEEAVFKVCNTAESQPRPYKWLQRCREECGIRSPGEMQKSAWYQFFLSEAELLIREGCALAEENLQLAGSFNGPAAYLPAAEADLDFFEELASKKDSESRTKLLRSWKPIRLSTKKPGALEDPDLREVFKEKRAKLKSLVEELAGGCYARSAEEAFDVMKKNEKPLTTLLNTAERFLRRFAEKKREKKLVDFADLEHFALRILRGDDGQEGRTAAAKELALHFKEVMCDEYQDSNDLQEEILTAVSRIEDGQNNYFCVGDVKQSIYAFRHAKPELFMKKYRDYGKNGGKGGGRPGDLTGIRIDLAKNFRSRPEVLQSANLLFEQFMVEGVGGVLYDEDAKLVPGAGFPDSDGDYATELLPILCGEEDGEGNAFLEDTTANALRELEARTIAERIRRMVGKESFFDSKSGETRKVSYRDIVILLRTMSGWSEIFEEVLAGAGIPASSTAKSGYFNASEVITILDYLDILDNPCQDIPFASVLRSPIVRLDAEELSAVRIVFGSPSASREASYKSLYACARAALAAEGIRTETRDKLEDFFSFYDRTRESLPYTPVHELVWNILSGTGFLAYASSLPGGSQRASNLRMLVEKAIAYEETSYAGLSDFTRYIKNLKKYDIDFGAASAASESENAVRIISIHKSKGLEFPIVFAAGMGKAFNRQDLNAQLLVDEKMGLAADYVDYTNRMRMGTIKKMAVRKRLLREGIGEELRILYVAFTRARVKLLISGTIRDEEKMKELLDLPQPLRELHFADNYIARAKNPFELLLPAADRALRREESDGRKAPLKIVPVKPSALAASSVIRQGGGRMALSALRTAGAPGAYDPLMAGLIMERFSFSYPFEGHAVVPAKISVSELKKAHLEEEELEALFPETERIRVVPAFMRTKEEQEEKGGSGTRRGTAFHRVMELLDYGRLPENAADSRSFVESEIRRMVSEGRMEQEDAELVRAGAISVFLESPLGKRFREAALKKRLYREQPFVLFVSASEVREDYPADEEILVQGIIDAFFYEEDGIVLVDYKTDRVAKAGELAERYKVQLDSYEEALSRVTGKKVKEVLIWSFALGCAVDCSRP
ncbi:MAG: helicase-exonuclease AddAB subunit AddA [Lachnospiraceae bacterium]|nr:helicase-exonuclease AddAB subunit AddA [Lachnospiraceae bacterium]